jgi:hypothetical protein
MSRMATETGGRTIDSEAARFFKGTAEERMRAALDSGKLALQLYLAAQPPGTTVEEARRRLQRAAHAGRRPSSSAESA